MTPSQVLEQNQAMMNFSVAWNRFRLAYLAAMGEEYPEALPMSNRQREALENSLISMGYSTRCPTCDSLSVTPKEKVA